MDSGDCPDPNHLTYSRSRVPVIGALIDYIDTSIEYLWTKTFVDFDKLYVQTYPSNLSASFMTFVCLIFGLAANIKLEVVTLDGKPLENDMHVVVMSKVYRLYVNDVDTSKILCCIEASDTVVILLSCLFVLTSTNVKSPMSEYFFLPWLGAALRGLLLRQAPTTAAVIYTMTIATNNLNPLFLLISTLFFFMELRLWLEIARWVYFRWQRREQLQDAEVDWKVQTLWNNEDTCSVEVRNYLY